MKFFDGMISKILGVTVLVVLGFFAWRWAMNALSPAPVQPPSLPVTSNPPLPSPTDSSASAPPPTPVASAPVPPSAAPIPVGSSPSADPTASPSSSPLPSEPSPSLVPNSSSASPAADNKSGSQPALALPNQPTLQVPKKLEKGGILKIYYNNDNNPSPDPLVYSASKTIKTHGLSLFPLDTDHFQEVSGYFLVKKTGTYNFAISLPANYFNFDLVNIRLKIDGTALPTVKGGRTALDEGWHEVSLFAYKADGNYVHVSWGQEGQDLQIMEVWREVQ